MRSEQQQRPHQMFKIIREGEARDAGESFIKGLNLHD